MRVLLVCILLAGCVQPSPTIDAPVPEQTPPPGLESVPAELWDEYPELHVEDLSQIRRTTVRSSVQQYTAGLGLGPDGCIGPPAVDEVNVSALPPGAELVSSRVWPNNVGGAGGDVDFRAIVSNEDAETIVTSRDPPPSVDARPSFDSVAAAVLRLEVCRTGVAYGPAAFLEQEFNAPNGHPYLHGGLIWQLSDPSAARPEQRTTTAFVVDHAHTARFGGDTETAITVRPGPITKAKLVDLEPENAATIELLNGVFTAAQMTFLAGHTSSIEATVGPDIRRLIVGDLDDDGGSSWHVDVEGLHLDEFHHPDNFGSYEVRDSSIVKLWLEQPADIDHVLRNVALLGSDHRGGGTWRNVTLHGDVIIHGTLVTEDLRFLGSTHLRGEDPEATEFLRADITDIDDVGFRFALVNVGEDQFHVDIPGVNVTYSNNRLTGQSADYDDKPIKVQVTGRITGHMRFTEE